jgi:hypothetical protein
MSLGTLGIRVRYQNVDEDSFRVEALLPIEENKDAWRDIGLVYQVSYDDGTDGWEFEEESGRTSLGKDRRSATCRALVVMGHARRAGDVLEDIPREERGNGRRNNA